MTNSRSGDEGKSQQGEQIAPRDLIDFYRRWADFRPAALDLAQRSDLSALERQTIHWLILLVDRIGEQDLEPLNRS
jgi:hypothetical protein